jgi:hypothetical protein
MEVQIDIELSRYYSHLIFSVQNNLDIQSCVISGFVDEKKMPFW